MTTAAPGAETPQPTPGWMVAVLGALLLPLAAGAFILSFEQLLPVMLLGGWSTGTAWIGPIVLDITAAVGAVMHVVSADRGVKTWGLGLLVSATVLSIFGNLAGHNIAIPGGRTRANLPREMTGWTLPTNWQPVVLALSIAAPTFVAVIVHAFGAVLKAWLATRPAADPTAAIDPTHIAIATRPDPTSGTESASDSARPDPTPTRLRSAVRPDPAVQSGTDSARLDPARLVSDSDRDLRKSDESGTRPDSTGQRSTRPDPRPTADPTGAVTRPDSNPTQPTDSTRPASDPTGQADPTPAPTEVPSDPTRPDLESDLADLVARARQLVESGEIRPTADAIRPALGVGQAKAREIRDALKNEQRPGLRAVS